MKATRARRESSGAGSSTRCSTASESTALHRESQSGSPPLKTEFGKYSNTATERIPVVNNRLREKTKPSKETPCAYLPNHPFTCPIMYIPIHLPVCLSSFLCVYTSVFFLSFCLSDTNTHILSLTHTHKHKHKNKHKHKHKHKHRGISHEHTISSNPLLSLFLSSSLHLPPPNTTNLPPSVFRPLIPPETRKSSTTRCGEVYALMLTL